MRGMKLSNEYQRALRTYEQMPKAVLAAVAFSFASRIIESADAATVEAAILNEWQVLHDNGIVPQEPK